jgi:hypothetical protein
MVLKIEEINPYSGSHFQHPLQPPRYAFLSSVSNAKNLSSPKADNPSNINKIHLQMSFTCFAKLVLENKKSPGADRALPF